MAFPQVSTVIDDFNRADGDIGAGAGATIWDDVGWGGAVDAAVVVNSNQMASSSGNQKRITLTELPSDMEFIVSFPVVSTGSFGIFFSLQNGDTSGWEGYFFYYDPGAGGYAIYKRISGSNSQIGTGSLTLVNNDKLGFHRVDDVIRVRRYTAGAWIDTPFIDLIEGSIQAPGTIGFEIPNTTWRLDDLIGGAAIAEVEGGGGGGDPDAPTEPVTMYVDADHPDASDTRTRIEGSDPDTPFLTVQKAANLAWATESWADTIQVEPADDANPSDPYDTSVYVGFMYDLGSPTTSVPFGDNTGNEPITIKGHVVGDVKPKVFQLSGASSLKNWTFEDFQVGYDRGSGHDNLTIGIQHNCGDLTYRRCKFTGGGFYVVSFTGTNLWEDCECYSPYSEFEGAGNRFLDGVGFHFIAIDTTDGTFRQGVAHFTGCHFEDIDGEDAIQCSLGPVALGTELIVENCSFMNIFQAEGGAHTDCIQSLGGYKYTVRNCTFIKCASPFIASDDHNGTIIFENNLLDGTPTKSMGFAFTAQGTDEYFIRNNTFINSFFGMSVAIGGRTEGVVQKLNIVNNITEDMAWDSAIVDEDSVIANNIVIAQPGLVTPYGTQLEGAPEFGTSSRMDDLPSPHNYELSNDPEDSPGIGEGIHQTDLATDRLGRAYTNPPDVGCHQSDSGTSIIAAPRAPYLVGRTPAPNATNVSSSTDMTVTFLPKPGESMDPSTINNTNIWIHGPDGGTLPVHGVELDDETGVVTLDINGTLYPLVTYTAVVENSVADTEGSTLGAVFVWTFQVAGLGGAAVFVEGEAPESGSVGWVIGTVDNG